eukprot:CAMPEP_0179459692 /NCGR_PEP_ID=MMETSP0799-20121207/42977_1 /TAXON_ID=46947 /ORGANISM="Geminigera cryophila, Strain CCMP2564" /LENGTH=708 /DNA_ID=CAMNT_0021261667 /DNA_START=161 /DNA_END=2287 /DNA_ORIENTATION=-
MANMEAELRSVLQAVLLGVCQRCDFVHGEALRPSGNACLVQSGASFCSTTGAADFHRASLNFYFPPNVSVAGRVWKSGCTEWHEDVSVLPTTAFLRSELALQTELKAAFAVPLCKDSRVLAVCIFYSRYALPANPQMEQTCIQIANEVLITTFARSHMDTSLRFVRGDPNVIEVTPSKTGASKAWQRCQTALESTSEERTEDQMEQITKFSKGIHFFKYITNTQRLQLCKTMQHTEFKKGQVVMTGGEHGGHNPNIWYVVIHGRVDMCVKTHNEGGTYRMCSFKEGDTFAASYMKMFQTSPNIQAQIESASDTSCIMITIPEEHQKEFRTNTRPLWYEELAQFFHISINEAADALGMCMSAIKKICRRHGISRWPHRKLASVNKTVAMLQSKINTAEDDASRAALRSEAVNVLTMKLRLTINPSYLVRDESVLLQPAMSTSAPGIPGGMTMPSVMSAGGMDMQAGPPPGGGGFSAEMGVQNMLRQQAESRALQAQEAAIMLQKVQSMAHGRVGMPGADLRMGMGPQGAYGGGPMGLHMQQGMMRSSQPGGSMAGGPSGRGKDDGEEGYIDNHDDYGDGERSMRQGQMHNPYAMMSGAMGMPGNFYGQGGMGGIGGMHGGQMGAAGGMGMYRHGPPDQSSFRQQPGLPGGGRPGPPPVGGDVSLGKRNAIDFLVSTGSGGPGGPAGASAGSHMEGGGGDSDKRPRHNPL